MKRYSAEGGVVERAGLQDPKKARSSHTVPGAVTNQGVTTETGFTGWAAIGSTPPAPARAPPPASAAPSNNSSIALLGGSVNDQLQYMRQMSAASAAPEQEQVPECINGEIPSKVIHFRNVTEDISQGDIMALAVQFGIVTNLLTMKNKNQCLLAFQSLKSAVEFSNYYAGNNTHPTVRGRKLYIAFSRHPGITAANSAVSSVLLVTLVCNRDPVEAGVPITPDVIWQIFQPYGTVEKVVMLDKADRTQTLVKYETQVMCANAFEYINDQKVYVGEEPNQVEITVQIQFSHLSDLTVHHSSGTSADYSHLKQQSTGHVAQAQYQDPTHYAQNYDQYYGQQVDPYAQYAAAAPAASASAPTPAPAPAPAHAPASASAPGSGSAPGSDPYAYSQYPAYGFPPAPFPFPPPPAGYPPPPAGYPPPPAGYPPPPAGYPAPPAGQPPVPPAGHPPVPPAGHPPVPPAGFHPLPPFPYMPMPGMPPMPMPMPGGKHPAGHGHR